MAYAATRLTMGTPSLDGLRTSPGAARREDLDVLRGLALVLMVVNHTARWWMNETMDPARYQLIYVTTALAGPLFLFIVGRSLAHSYDRRQSRGWFHAAGHYSARAGGLLVAGWLLNLVVVPESPLASGGVLQTIGIGVLVAALALPALRWIAGRVALLLLAVAGYTAFAATAPSIARWAAAHAVAGPVLFSAFPPWPWVFLILVGLVVSWVELEQPTPAARRQYRLLLAVAGVAVTLGAVEAAWSDQMPLLHFHRDIVILDHWTPGPATATFLLGILLLSVPAGRWLTAGLRRRLGWLALLGQAALALYVVHQIVVLTLVRQMLGVLVSSWVLYAGANVALLAVLVGLARLWLALWTPLRARVTFRRLRRRPGGLPPGARTAA